MPTCFFPGEKMTITYMLPLLLFRKDPFFLSLFFFGGFQAGYTPRYRTLKREIYEKELKSLVSH